MTDETTRPGGVLTVAPDGTPMATAMLMWTDDDGLIDFACCACGHQTSCDPPATAEVVQRITTTHRCGGPTWD